MEPHPGVAAYHPPALLPAPPQAVDMDPQATGNQDHLSPAPAPSQLTFSLPDNLDRLDGVPRSASTDGSTPAAHNLSMPTSARPPSMTPTNPMPEETPVQDHPVVDKLLSPTVPGNDDPPAEGRTEVHQIPLPKHRARPRMDGWRARADPESFDTGLDNLSGVRRPRESSEDDPRLTSMPPPDEVTTGNRYIQPRWIS